MENIDTKAIKIAGKIFISIIAIGTILSLVKFVPANTTAVVFDKFTGSSDSVLTEGVNLKYPWQSVFEISNQVVSVGREDISAASSDMQGVYIDAVINYRIMPEGSVSVFKKYKQGIVDKLIMPSLNEAIKSETAQNSAYEILAKRQEITDSIKNRLYTIFEKEGVTLEDVSLVDISFSEAFEKAIEAKQVQAQLVEQQRFILEKQKLEADQSIAIAEANKKSKILEAEGLSEYNRLTQQTIDDRVLALKKMENERAAIEKWNGAYPSTVLGDSVPMINIK